MSVNRNREYYVVKGNELIQHAMYSMTTQQQKLILYFISKIRPLDNAGQLYSISIREFCDICGIEQGTGSSYINIKNSLDKIDSIRAWILKDGKYERFKWFNRLIINPNDEKILASFHETIWEELYELHERYTRYQLINVLPMRSRYSIRIYELCSSYCFAGSFEMELDEFRKVIGISEEGGKKYATNGHLKARILDKACEEINEFTNLHISYELIKEGRSFKRIKFTIREKNITGNALAHIKQMERLNK